MKLHKTLLLFLLLLLTVLAAACAPAPAAEEQAGISLQDCTLSAPGASPVKARCGTLRVAENPAAPDGRQIDLHVAVVPAVSRDPEPDPIFLLAGGPGQAATEAFLPLLPSMERMRFKRDVVLVDQRGTGQSNPLRCPEPAQTPEVLGVALPLRDQLAELSACRDALNTDPSLYRTDVAMADLDQVRAALGYEQVNLLGVSYGTRAALTYLRLYPERVRTLVLDGVVPPGWALGSSLSPDAQRALDLLFARCAQDAQCAETFPDLPGQFEALMTKLAAEPQEVTVPDPVTAAPKRVLVSPETVGITVRLMSYSDLSAALIPLAVNHAAQGDYSMLASQYLTLTSSLDESMGMGMYFSVICAEDIPLLKEDGMDTSGYFDPQWDVLYSGCSYWRGAANGAAAADTALNQDTPTLLISGEADPVTPPANAERVAELLPNSLHIVAPGLGHNNYYVGCIPDLLLEFLETASPEGLDTGCVDAIQPMPFFLSPSGPQP